MERERQGRHAPFAFVCAMLLTVGAGITSLYPQSRAFAAGATTSSPNVVLDAAPSHDASTGTMAGQAGTDGGASTYRVPIVVPPGRAGMQPSLALVYNSRSGDGVAGLGWSISGLSSIHRCPQTPEQDGQTRGVSYTLNDRLCLDGQRLVKVGGSYGQLNATYKTEIDSYARITQLGGNIDGASAWFKVEQKDGRILYYGTTANSRVAPSGTGGKPLSWLVDKIEDRVGNFQSYSYNVSQGYGEVLLDTVTYTGLNGAAGNRTVKFGYKTRTAAASGAKDIASSALAGGLTMQTQALDWIKTAVNGVTVRKYTPAYANSNYSQRLIMTSLQECAGEASPCHPATQFTYNDGTLNFQLKSLQGLGLPSTLPATGESNENHRIRLAGDYDGDGTRETIVSANVGSMTHTYLTQFSADRIAHISTELLSPYNQLASEHILEADMDGSGRSALIGLQLDPDNVAFGLWDYNLFPRGAPATGNPFGTVYTDIPRPESYGTAHGQTKFVLPADVDGDGKSDIVTIHPDSSCNSDSFGPKDGVFLYRNIAQGPFSIGQTVSFASPIKLFCLPRITGGITFAEASIDHIGDFNGDGLADFYLVYAGGLQSYVSGVAGIAVTSVNATGVASAEVKTCTEIGLLDNGTDTDDCSGDQNYATRWMDVNADGLEDFVIARPSEGTWKLRINQGNGQLGPQIDTGKTDGLTRDATGALAGAPYRFRYANRLPAMDVDSDGKADLLIPSQLLGAQAFALKMCTIKRVPKIAGADGSLCPSALGSSDQSVFNAPETGEVCAAYSCPPNPDGSQTLPPNNTRENRGYPYQWNSLPAFDAYSSHDNHEGPGEDNSIYHLAQLKFVQTGASSFDVVVVETPMVSRLSDYYGRADDLFGDGLPDLLTSVGCSDLIISQAGSQTTAPWSYQKCSVVTTANGTAYGPTTFPDGTSTSNFANKVVLFANVNQGLSAPGGSTGGASIPAAQRPVAPTLTSSGPGVSLSLPVPNLPGMMDSAINGVGDFATWGYFPLSVRASRDNVPFYTVRSDSDPNGYTDKRHYYFQSSMPVVYGMAQNSGDGSVNGFRSAFYGYTEAMYHHLGRGFQGFRTIVSNNIAPPGQSWRQLRTTTTFHQKFPLTGRIETVETTVPGTGRLLKRETDTWICGSNRSACPQGDGLPNPAINSTGGTVYTPLLDTQRVDNFDFGTGAAVSHTTTVNALAESGGASGWDLNGNLITQVVTSADDGAGGSFVSAHTVTTNNTYVPADTNNWWLDRLSSSQVQTALTFDAGRRPPDGSPTAPTRIVTTSYDWNSPNRTPNWQSVTASGKTLTTTYSYKSTTAAGLPSSVTISGTGIAPARMTQFTYTKDGTSAASQADGYFVLTTTNAALHSTTTEHSTRDGQVTVQIDPNNLKITSAYDGFGRLVGVSFLDANGDTMLKPVTIGYSKCTAYGCVGGGYGDGDNQSGAAWRVVRQQNGSPTSVDWFDVLGRTIKHAERGFSESDFVETFTEYDAMGTVSTQSTPFYRLDGNGALTAWSYDTLNRPTQKNSPGGQLDPANGDMVTTYTYNGSKTTIKVRAAGVASTCSSSTNLCMDMTRSYDVLGRLEQTVQNNGGTANYAKTDYWYDGLGNPIATRDAGGAVITANYNDLGQRTDLNDPDAGHWQFFYNALGEVVDQTDARGVGTHHVYDVLGRLTERTATDNGASDPSLKVIRDTWVYDPAPLLGFTFKGLLDYTQRQKGSSVGTLGLPIWKEASAYESTTKRLSYKTTTLEGRSAAWQTSYFYDTYGRPQTTAYPSGLIVQNVYTGYGDLRELSNYTSGAVYWTGDTKDAWGNVTAESYLDGSISGTHKSYSSTGQSWQKQWTSSTGLLNQLDYHYDSFGNLKTQSSLLDGVTASETYVYDGLQRLTQATRSGVSGNPAPITYAYDPNGNLSAKSDYSFSTPGSYSYGANGCGPHAASRVGRSGGPHTYNCDANGNVIGGSTLSATYDFNNQPWLINRLDAGTQAQFGYTSEGQVFRTVTGTQSTWFGPGGYEETESGGLTQRHELGPVVVLRQGGVDTAKAVLRDRLGSQVMLVAGAGEPAGLQAPVLSAAPNPSYDGHYTISWNAVAGATQYQLYESNVVRGEVQVYQGPATNWSPPAAKAPLQYTYRVKACNTTCSDFSQPLGEDVVPPPPATVTTSPNPSTTGNFQVSWSIVSGAKNFVVEEKGPGSTTFQEVATGVTTTSWDAMARSNGIWQYRVKSCLATGACGNPSTPPVSETVNSTGGGLQPPGWITSNDQNSSDGTYTISWEGNPNATYWKLEEFMGGNWVRYVAVLTTPSMQINIRPTGDYRYRALACDANTCSAPSAEFAQHVASANVPYAVPGLTVDPPISHDGTYTIDWGTVPGANITYRLDEISPSQPAWHEVANQATTGKLFQNREDGSYQYRVKACNAAGCSTPGAIIYPQVRIQPDAPVFNTPATAVNGHLTLNWSAPPTTTHYLFEERLNGGSWLSPSDVTGVLTANTLGLDRGNGTYEYRVQACSVHCSGWSNVVSTTVSGSPFATMPASINSSLVGCFDGNQTTFTISWGSGGVATSYQLHEVNAILNIDRMLAPSPVSATSMQLTRKKNEPGQPFTDSSTWEYEVRACAVVGGATVCSPYKGSALACIGIPQAINGPTTTPTTTAYDAFGKVRNGDYSDRLDGKLNTLPDTVHGFTGHQHVDDVRLIHMNGRVYDYQLGRFLSVDPVIQFPTSTQSMNPYSYIMNNPLSGRDPTGYAVADADSICHGVCLGVVQTFDYETAVAESKENWASYKQSKNGNQSQSIKNISGDASVATSPASQKGVNNSTAPMNGMRHSGSGTQSVGEMIDSGAQGCGDVSCAGWAVLSASWSVFGAESVSQISAHGLSGASGGEMAGAGLEVLAAIPLVGIVKEGVTIVRGGAEALRAGQTATRATGLVASNGTKIAGLTRHGIDRVIGDAAKRAGTRPQAILDALKNPKKIAEGVDKQGRPFQIFTGSDARVVVNPETGKIVSVNPLSGAGAQ